MAWYGQKNYSNKMGNGPYTIAQIGCFVTAFCNLLQKFGTNIDPATLNNDFTSRGVYLAAPEDGPGVKDNLGWNSVTAYDGQVKVMATGGPGWPDTNNAIVKFAYKSPKTGAATTHFCLVADQNMHTIVDSYDGVIRTTGYYGDPVAWATYENIVPQPVIVAPTPVVPPAANNASGTAVTMIKGDTITSIALRYGFDAQELLDHNDLSWAQARELPVGYVVHLPVANAPTPANSGYKIEVLPEPKTMHISKAGGAEKWGFGSVKQWSDFVPNGLVAQNTNITVVAVATVIIGNETAAYYMDTLAVGDYATSGKVANTIGFNWSDLADGPYTLPAPEKPAEPAPEPEKPPEITPTPVAPAPAVEPSDSSPHAYKTSYKAFAQPKIFVANETLMCEEYDGRRPDHELLKNQAVKLSGTFIYGQELLGRPYGAVKSGYWFGVPLDKLISEDELYSTQVDLPTKAIMHYTMSITEKIDVLLARIVSVFKKK